MPPTGFVPRTLGNPNVMDVSREFRFSPRPNRAARDRVAPVGRARLRGGSPARAPRPALTLGRLVPLVPRDGRDELLRPAGHRGHQRALRPGPRGQRPHPDVNRRYNMGGWPTTAFLAASGESITGGTYMPPDQMLETLARVKAFFAANRRRSSPSRREPRAADGSARGPTRRRAAPTASLPADDSRATPTCPATSPPRSPWKSSTASTRCTAAPAPSPSSRSRTCSASCSPTPRCAAPATRSTPTRGRQAPLSRPAWRKSCAPRSPRWRRAACTTTSAAASTGMRRGVTGRCRTTRRCSRTTPGWPRCIWSRRAALPGTSGGR